MLAEKVQEWLTSENLHLLPLTLIGLFCLLYFLQNCCKLFAHANDQYWLKLDLFLSCQAVIQTWRHQIWWRTWMSTNQCSKYSHMIMILWSESFDVTNQFSPDTKNFLKNHTTYLVLAIEYYMNFYIINNWHNLRLTLILQT